MQVSGHFNLSHKQKKATLKMEYVRTPIEIWNKLKTEYNFTVDACASDKNHLLPKYWTKENSALNKNWDNEIVYCHPMYDITIPKFIEKAFKHKCICVFLLPASTNAVYFHKYFWNAAECKSRDNIKIEFLPRGNQKQNYIFRTDEGIEANHGYLRPLMLVHKLK